MLRSNAAQLSAELPLADLYPVSALYPLSAFMDGIVCMCVARQEEMESLRKTQLVNSVKKNM